MIVQIRCEIGCELNPIEGKYRASIKIYSPDARKDIPITSCEFIERADAIASLIPAILIEMDNIEKSRKIVREYSV